MAAFYIQVYYPIVWLQNRVDFSFWLVYIISFVTVTTILFGLLVIPLAFLVNDEVPAKYWMSGTTTRVYGKSYSDPALLVEYVDLGILGCSPCPGTILNSVDIKWIASSWFSIIDGLLKYIRLEPTLNRIKRVQTKVIQIFLKYSTWISVIADRERFHFFVIITFC